MRSAVRLLLLATLLAACGDAGNRAAAAAADSAAAPREPETPYGWMPPRDTAGSVGTIGDEAGSYQVVATLKEWGIELTPSNVAAGEVTIRLENQGERPHQIEVRNVRAGRWRSAMIPPGGTVTMTMPMQPANYDVVSADTSYVERGMQATLVVR